MPGAMAAPSASPASTFLRATWCGGFIGEADFDGNGTVYEKLVTFEDPLTVEQSGGFTFSNHPDALSIDWDLAGGTIVGPNHTLHRISVPEDGVYTVILDYFLRTQFVDISGVDQACDYVEVETKVQPDDIRITKWFHGFLGAGQSTVGRSSDASFTVELFTGTPFFITVNPDNKMLDGSAAPGASGITRLSDASLTVFK